MYFDNTKIISNTLSDDYNLFQINHVHLGRHLWVARAPAPQTESTWKPPHSIHLEVQEPEKKIIQIWALQMIDPAKRSQPKCNSQQRQNTAPEFVGFIQHQITRKL